MKAEPTHLMIMGMTLVTFHQAISKDLAFFPVIKTDLDYEVWFP